MQIQKLLIVAVLALGLPCVGCNKANKVVVETTTMPTGPVELKLKWPIGRHGILNMDMKQTGEMTIPGMPQPMLQEMTLSQDSSLTVMQGIAPGKRDLEMEYLTAKMSTTIAGKSVLDYDSKQTYAGNTNPASATLGKMIGAKIRFALDDSNQIESVEGADELAASMTSTPGSDPNGMLKNMFRGDALKQAVDFAYLLPGKPVQPGDTWPVQREYSMGPMGIIILDYTFTFDSWVKSGGHYCARIEMAGTLKSKHSETPSTPGMSFTISDGKTSGETLFDLDMGMFVSRTLDQDMQMDIAIPNPMAGSKPGVPKMMAIKGKMSQVITTQFELK